MQVGAITDSVVTALKQAAQATGSDFHYLLGTAMRESSLKPEARSTSSSASGLFQFVDQTWLELVKNHGAKYGLGGMAEAISCDSSGHYRVANDADRRSILDLRQNPQISALMAGEYANASAAALQSQLGRPVCGGELYAAHFLGADGAAKLIRATQSAPGASAPALLPAAAAANHTVFFHADGSAKSVREVYDWALAQPGSNAPVRADAAPSGAEAMKLVTGASTANMESLLASVMNWQPSGGDYFKPGKSSLLSLTPELLGLLSES